MRVGSDWATAKACRTLSCERDSAREPLARLSSSWKLRKFRLNLQRVAVASAMSDVTARLARHVIHWCSSWWMMSSHGGQVWPLPQGTCRSLIFLADESLAIFPPS